MRGLPSSRCKIYSWIFSESTPFLTVCNSVRMTIITTGVLSSSIFIFTSFYSLISSLILYWTHIFTKLHNTKPSQKILFFRVVFLPRPPDWALGVCACFPSFVLCRCDSIDLHLPPFKCGYCNPRVCTCWGTVWVNSPLVWGLAVGFLYFFLGHHGPFSARQAH